MRIVRAGAVRMNLWLGVGVVVVAAVAAAGAFGVSRDDTIRTIAGDRFADFSGDGGPAISARLNTPSAVAVDARGNVYIADSWNNRVRKVSPGGKITTFAGTGPVNRVGGYSGDGGPASSAQLDSPTGVAVNNAGTSTSPTRGTNGCAR